MLLQCAFRIEGAETGVPGPARRNSDRKSFYLFHDQLRAFAAPPLIDLQTIGKPHPAQFVTTGLFQRIEGDGIETPAAISRLGADHQLEMGLTHYPLTLDLKNPLE